MRRTGSPVAELQQSVNLRPSQIEHVLKLLMVENPAPIIKDGSTWYRTAADYAIDHDRIAFLTGQRSREWEEIQQ